MGPRDESPIIEKVVIKNYKKFENATIPFNRDITIIVGGNESGKTTIIEAINICLKLQINNRSVASEITPHMFNHHTLKKYFNDIEREDKKERIKIEPPSILIEVYFEKNSAVAKYTGTNNSQRIDVPGVKVIIELDEKYRSEFNSYISESDQVIDSIPVEYYSINRLSFSNATISYNELPVKPFTIANMENRFQNGVDRFITEMLDETLQESERAKLSVSYRSLKSNFLKMDEIESVNNKIHDSGISDKIVTLSVDVSSKTSLDSSLTLYVDDIPLKYSGKGEQTAIKAKLALKSKSRANLIMFEEPETNQSFSNMRMLIASMIEFCNGKQVIITTHSSYVINKYGLEKILLLSSSTAGTFNPSFKNLSQETYDYFKKLPGYDTLRAILSRKVILVEGPSDELIVQKAYFSTYGVMPLDEGVDVISVSSLAFPRFLDILKIVGNEADVITDNDGDIDSNRLIKLKSYESDNIRIHIPDEEEGHTLEPCFVNCNDLEVMNKVLNKNCKSKEDLIKYMGGNNKTTWALAVFDTETKLQYPEYIVDAIKK